MKFFFSGDEAVRDGALRDWVISNCPSRLKSCHGAYLRGARTWLQRSVEIGAAPSMDIMLDSGAFTAWSLGHPITLDDLLPVYKELQQQYAAYFKSMVFINLDVIPGTRETPPTEQQIVQSLIDSDINFDVLKNELGPFVLPVFHQGEDWERLPIICSQSPYVCISPRQTVSENHRVAWVRTVSAKLAGMGIEAHGLATTGSTIIRAHNWYSVDSASWVITGGLGNILLPEGARLQPVSVSATSPGRQKKDAHVTTLSAGENEYVRHRVEHYGFDLDVLATSHEHRIALNLVTTREWSDSINNSTPEQSEGLFDKDWTI